MKQLLMMESDLDATLRAAKENAPDCDLILVLMQNKKGGMQFYAPDSTRLETLSFMAQQFLHHIHTMLEG